MLRIVTDGAADILPSWKTEYGIDVIPVNILFGERSLWHVLNEYMAHYHTERPHQGKGNVILFPPNRTTQTSRRIYCRERLGGLLKYYDRETA